MPREGQGLRRLVAAGGRFVATPAGARTLLPSREAVTFAAMRKTVTARAPVNLRRAYLECRYGQVHLRTAFPSTGGFDERNALVCLHAGPFSCRSFEPFLPEIGRDRSVYAPDAPGCGESDPPPSRPAIADYAVVIGEFLDSLRLREVDVLGHHASAAVAAELAVQRPALVRRLVFVGLPLYTAADRDAFNAEPRPVPTAAAAAQLHNGPRAWWLESAARSWPGVERLRLVSQRALVLRPKDELWEQTLRGRSLLASAAWRDLPERDAGLFTAAPAEVAAEVRRFLDTP
jgi:pimeloyl-ACP methyl ester carboxylesterase